MFLDIDGILTCVAMPDHGSVTGIYYHNIVAVVVNPLPDNKILYRSELKQIADETSKCI